MRALHALGVAADVDAADRRRAGRRLQQAAQHPDRRRLAGAVAAEEAEDLARPRRRTTRGRRRRSSPNRRVRSRTTMACHGASRYLPSARSSRASASRTLASACVRSSSACSSATCASSTSVLVATPAAKRSPTTRRASAAARTRVVGGGDGRAGRLEVEPPLPHLDLEHRCRTPPAARRAARWSAAASRHVGLRRGRRPQNVQVTFTPTSHERLPLVRRAGRCAGSGCA